MAVTFTKYTHAHKILCGDGDWTDSTIKLALVTSSYSFSAAHTVWADASANEVASGDGYTTGGETLGSTTKSDTVLDAADVTWSTLTKTFRGAVLYISGTVESLTNPVLAYISFDSADVGVVNKDFTVMWSASGIFTL